MDTAARQAGLPNAMALQRRNILPGNKTINQVGTVVDRGRVGNRGTAIAGGGMLMDSAPGRGGGAATGPMYAMQADPVRTFRQTMTRIAAAPQGAPSAPSQPAASARVDSAITDIFRPKVAAVDSAMRGVIPVRNNTSAPLRNSEDMPTRVRLKGGSTFTTPDRKESFHLYLLMGQSNMVGRDTRGCPPLLLTRRPFAALNLSDVAPAAASSQCYA